MKPLKGLTNVLCVAEHSHTNKIIILQQPIIRFIHYVFWKTWCKSWDNTNITVGTTSVSSKSLLKTYFYREHFFINLDFHFYGYFLWKFLFIFTFLSYTVFLTWPIVAILVFYSQCFRFYSTSIPYADLLYSYITHTYIHTIHACLLFLC